MNKFGTDEEQKISITVYQKNKNVTKIELKFNDQITVQIGKNITENSQQYSVSFATSKEDNSDLSIGLTANFEGLQTLQNINEKYELSIQLPDEDMTYTFENNVAFADSVNIEEFSNENSLFLDEVDEEQRNAFIEAVIQRIKDVNKLQMEELKLKENENPLQYAIPSFLMNYSSTNEINNSSLSEAETSAFNAKFEMYEGTNIRGTTVKGLLTTIALNNSFDTEDEETNNDVPDPSIFSINENDQELIKEIHFDGNEYEVNNQNITLIKSSIETESYYRVEFEKDENTGKIYRVVINKK